MANDVQFKKLNKPTFEKKLTHKGNLYKMELLS